MGIPVHVLPEVQVVAETQAANNRLTFSLFNLLTFTYIAGMAGLLLLRLWQMGRLQLGLKRGVLWHSDEGGIRIYCHAEDVAPFSWMRSVVISQRDWNEAGREIVLHEKGHILGGHSWDVVLLTLVQMVQWWNPMCYMLGVSLRDVHEYEADSYVLRQGVSAQGYQLLLIRKAVGSGSSLWSGSGTYAFANSFNHSLTKKRITMMKRIKSNPWMRARALYVIPVAALALCAFATPKFVAPIEETVTKLEGKGTENSANLQVLEQENEPVVQKDMAQSSAANVTSEEVKQQDTDEQPLFVLNGKIIEIPEDMKDISFKRMHEEQLTELLNINVEDIESITVLKNEEATKIWGDKGANGVIVITTRSGQQSDAAEVSNDTIYNVVKEVAKFPGGDSECFEFLSENIRYPKLCHDFGVQGRVIVRFVVEKDGSITHIEKLRGQEKTLSEEEVTSYKQEHPNSEEQLEAGQDLGELLYEEAARVLKEMPKWEPAKDDEGNPVRSIMSLPFMFRLR
jgi:TonB-dependent SusC/RagA subfamily outer membrane receptor